MRIGLMGAATGAVLLVTAGAAVAQTPAAATKPGSGGVVKPSANEQVKPGAVVDPGMTVIHPKMPPGSTPVIKPKTTTRDGRVVVPR